MKLYDANKIVPGLAVFLAIALFPVWNGLTQGQSVFKLDLETPGEAKNCVLEKQNMRLTHMDLLNQWRDKVVREGERVYVSPDNNQRFTMSLTRTCLGCHTNKEKFCDQCHNAAGVQPYCWDCHVVPTEPASTLQGAPAREGGM